MIDISKIFKETSNIKDNQLQFLLESGVDPELAFFLEGGELPSHANGYEVQNPPIDQNLEGAPQQAILPQDNIINYQGKEWVVYGDRMVPREVVDKGQASVYTSGNYTNEQFFSPYQQNLREEQALAQSSNTINSITSGPQPVETPSNNGNDYSSYGDFSTAFAMARQKLGPKNTFTFNGKTYNTNLAGEGASTRKPTSQSSTRRTNVPEGFVEVKNINNTGKDFIVPNTTIDKDGNIVFQGRKYSKENFLNNWTQRERLRLEGKLSDRDEAILRDQAEKINQWYETTDNEGNNVPKKEGNKKITQEDIKKLGELNIPAKTKTKVPTKVNDGFDVRNNVYNLNGRKLTREQLVQQKRDILSQLNGPYKESFSSKARELSSSLSKINNLLDSSQEEKNKVKIADMKAQGENIIFNGKSYNLRNDNDVKKLSQLVSESESGMFSREGRQKLAELSYNIFKNTPADKRKGLNSFLEGGEIPMFLGGGEKDKNGNLIVGINELNSLNAKAPLGTIAPQTITPQSLTPTLNLTEQDKLVYYSGKQNIDGRGANIAPGYYKQSDINKWESQSFSNASNFVSETAKTEDQLRQQDNLMKMFNVATGDTSFGVEDALYKVGESLAYKPLDADFRNPDTGEINKVGQDVASGFNIMGGVSAAGKALLGGTRNVLEGYSTEKRNRLLMQDYYRKQANAMINSGMVYSEDGGEIPFFNDGGYLKFLEEGDQMQYSEMGPQQDRPQMPITEEMTGEFLQQQPSEAGITPNAEVENREYVQHPDGQVQQVKGRTHDQGGERVALEGGSKVVSDKLKLGAKNAKLLREQFGLDNIKASDTYAVAVEKYSKKIGLKELNEQQQQYFDKLKKEKKTKDETTSELNNEVLSDKINDIEQKKSTLEEIRAKFTDYTYQLQENGKVGSSRNNTNKSESTPEFSLGGSLPIFADGGIIAMAKEMRANLTDAQLNTLRNIARTGDLTVEQVYNLIRENSELKDNLPADFKTFSSSNKLRTKIDFKKVNKDLEVINKDADKFNFYTADTPSPEPKVSTITPGANAKSIQDLEALNNMRGSNSLDATTGGENWKSPYDSINNYRKSKGLAPVQFSTHKDYQNYLTNSFSPQIIALYKNNQEALTNAHRKILKDNGVKNADNILYWNQIDPATQTKLGDDFITQGYTDGIAGHRGITFQGGAMTEEEYDKMDTSNRPYDKLTDSFGNKIYFEYNADGSVKKGPNGELIAYYPSGKKVPEQEVVNATSDIGAAPKVKPKTYNRPILPDMSLEPPRPMEAHLKAEHRYATIDPTKISYEDALTELNRQSDAAVSQLDGLTDVQRAAAISNLTANTQSNAAKVISQTNAQNAQMQSSVDQANVQIANREVDANVADAQAYEAIQMKAKALTEADVDNFHDKNREIRIKRNEFLRRDKQINDMIENYYTDANGNIMYDNNGYPIPRIATGNSNNQMTMLPDGTMRDASGRIYKVVTDSNGNIKSEEIVMTGNTGRKRVK